MVLWQPKNGRWSGEKIENINRKSWDCGFLACSTTLVASAILKECLARMLWFVYMDLPWIYHPYDVLRDHFSATDGGYITYQITYDRIIDRNMPSHSIQVCARRPSCSQDSLEHKDVSCKIYVHSKAIANSEKRSKGWSENWKSDSNPHEPIKVRRISSTVLLINDTCNALNGYVFDPKGKLVITGLPSWQRILIFLVFLIFLIFILCNFLSNCFLSFGSIKQLSQQWLQQFWSHEFPYHSDHSDFWQSQCVFQVDNKTSRRQASPSSSPDHNRSALNHAGLPRATQGWFHPTSVSIWHLHAFLAVPRQHWPREAQQNSDMGTCGPSSHSCLQFWILSAF